MIKNHTSTVPVSKTVSLIEQLLANHGAKEILKMYDGFGGLSGIAFIINVSGNDMPFRLPSRIDRIVKKMESMIKRPRKNTYSNIKEQAARTGWTNLLLSLQLQMTQIDTDQVEFAEIMMPFLYDRNKNQTFFENWKGNNFAMLEYKK